MKNYANNGSRYNYANQWYKHKSEAALENRKLKFYGKFVMPMNYPIQAMNTDLTLANKENLSKGGYQLSSRQYRNWKIGTL